MIVYIINKNDLNNYVTFEFSEYYLNDLINMLASLINISDYYISFEYKEKEKF